MLTKSFFLTLLVGLKTLSASSDAIDQYLEYLERYPNTLGPIGSFEKGEIEIIIDREKMLEIEALLHRPVGLLVEDKYWLWINDAVRFPNGTYGIYGRILWKTALTGVPAVCVVPLFPDGRIALNRNFRHATRSWEYELPRGGIFPNESENNAALRELKEETGFIPSKITLLGYVYPDTGMATTIMPIYSANISRIESPEREDGEAIEAVELFTKEELKQGFLDGYLTTEICGEQVKVNLRDPFLAFALLHLDLRND